MMKAGAVSNPRSRLKWDTFLSFQRDTSHKFTGRLYEAFIKEEVRVWNDDVKCGDDDDDDDDELRPSLVEAIDDSVAYVIVLSPNYANSHLRLEELAMLCDLRSSLKRLVFPIFYEIQPWEVKTQLGPYEKDFEEYSKRFGEEKIQRWRSALNLVGNISGLIYGY
ncbi:Disease resistance protein RPV1 [Cardamine amara subsp. amara]|uniref:Disease resistance protein RPV1 n=1 Tax=Cardamine amara subsp. amara TaxID=228776 RepID=A0ABD1BP72_CARAN